MDERTRQASCADSTRSYYISSLNKKTYDLESAAVGSEKDFDSDAPRPGDLVLGYVNDPKKAVVALCEFVAPKEHDKYRLRVIRKLTPDEMGRVRLGNLKNLAKTLPDDSSFRKWCNTHQGKTFVKISAPEWESVISAAVGDAEAADATLSSLLTPLNGYGREDYLNDVFMDAGRLDDLLGLLERKKNVILQGPPGTGKTYAARRLAYVVMGRKDDSHIKFVQFHQNTTYDDIVYGWRPARDKDGKFAGYELKPGVFTEFCDVAREDSVGKYFFIIDEINRADVSKVFGELLMLIERDHRGEELSLSINDEPFSVPENLYIIGAMNTADRGLALIDYALRRRFAFFTMEPAFGSQQLKERLEDRPGLSKLAKAVEEVNKDICEDGALGEGFRIGHSYFMDGDEAADDAEADSIRKYELEPLIDEYWFENKAKRDEAKGKLNPVDGNTENGAERADET